MVDSDTSGEPTRVVAGGGSALDQDSMAKCRDTGRENGAKHRRAYCRFDPRQTSIYRPHLLQLHPDLGDRFVKPLDGLG